MSTDTVKKAKLRDDGRIKRLFQGAESRHFTDEEFAKYLSLYPDGKEKELAAREIIDRELEVVLKTIKQVFSMYPYPKYHELPLEKCTRDVSYISVYATHSMMLDDPEWFRDKLLIWFKTILQSFVFPAREQQEETQRTALPNPEITKHADTLPQGRRSIYECYSRLIVNYQDALSPKTFNMLKPHLQLALDILSSD